MDEIILSHLQVFEMHNQLCRTRNKRRGFHGGVEMRIMW